MATTETVHGTVKKIVWTWTSDGSGDASEAASEVYDGEVLGLTTIPDGTDAPTDNYDIVVNDAEGHDVLLGAGADRDTANTEHVDRQSLGAAAAMKLTLVVSNAGSAKKGTVILYVR